MNIWNAKIPPICFCFIALCNATTMAKAACIHWVLDTAKSCLQQDSRSWLVLLLTISIGNPMNKVQLMIYTKSNMRCCEILLKIAIFLAISFFYYFLYRALTQWLLYYISFAFFRGLIHNYRRAHPPTFPHWSLPPPGLFPVLLEDQYLT